MLRLDKTFVQTQIEILSSKKKRLQWLVELDVRAEKVVNFGCHVGAETLASIWALEAREAVGIDKDEEYIHQAQSTFAYMQDDAKRIGRTLHSSRSISEDDKTWWSVAVPSFFKKELLREGFRLDFVVGDITKPTGLVSDYYDVAFCDFVLHHIWFDQERKKAQEDTQFAIKEMARVVRPGGVIAVFEPIQCPDKPKLDLGPFFEQAGLKLVHTKEIEVNGSQRHRVKAEYLCEKP